MRSRPQRLFYVLIAAAWVCVLSLGGYRLWSYESTAGAADRPPLTWPSESRVTRTAGLPTLVMLVHPKCPCTRATINELAKLMTDCQGKLTAAVLVIRPDATPEGWERTGLWDDAAAIPGVCVLSDAVGVDSRRFGAATSGQTLLFSADGRLLFSGGITESRGHAGDNAGRSAIVALVCKGDIAPAVYTPVYGCPLCDELSIGQKEGIQACPRK